MTPHKKMHDVSISVSKLTRILSDFVRQEMVKSGYRKFHSTTAMILLPLLEKEGLTLSELARNLHMKAPTITVLANRLENKGLIRRQRGTEDRRQMHLYLTKTGLNKAKVLQGVQKKAIQHMVKDLNVEEVSMTQTTLARIINNIHSTLN